MNDDDEILLTVNSSSMMWDYEINVLNSSSGSCGVEMVGSDYSENEWPIFLGSVNKDNAFRELCLLLADDLEIQISAGGLPTNIAFGIVQDDYRNQVNNELLEACWVQDGCGIYFLSFNDEELKTIFDIAGSLFQQEILDLANAIKEMYSDLDVIKEINEELFSEFGPPDSLKFFKSSLEYI